MNENNAVFKIGVVLAQNHDLKFFELDDNDEIKSEGAGIKHLYNCKANDEIWWIVKASENITLMMVQVLFTKNGTPHEKETRFKSTEPYGRGDLVLKIPIRAGLFAGTPYDYTILVVTSQHDVYMKDPQIIIDNDTVQPGTKEPLFIPVPVPEKYFSKQFLKKWEKFLGEFKGGK